VFDSTTPDPSPNGASVENVTLQSSSFCLIDFIELVGRYYPLGYKVVIEFNSCLCERSEIFRRLASQRFATHPHWLSTEVIPMHKTRRHLFLPLLALTLIACNHAPSQVAAASSGSEAAQDEDDSASRSLQIGVSNTHRTYACHNQDDSVQVTGSNDTLTITGNCGSLQVTGNSNSITIDSVQSVQFTGKSNSVFYQSSHRPSLSDSGESNSLAHAVSQTNASHSKTRSSDSGRVTSSDQGGSTTVVNGPVGSAVSAALEAAASTAGLAQVIQNQGNSVNITLSNQKTTQDCGDGKDVNINGYQNEITLTGSCSQVNVNGWQNTVHITEAAGIQVTGHTNTVTWERGRGVREPTVQVRDGMNNSVRQLAPATQ